MPQLESVCHSPVAAAQSKSDSEQTGAEGRQAPSGDSKVLSLQLSAKGLANVGFDDDIFIFRVGCE
jgi:hypothetical protein